MNEDSPRKAAGHPSEICDLILIEALGDGQERVLRPCSSPRPIAFVEVDQAATMDNEDSPREAALRLLEICDLLEAHQVPVEKIGELRAVGERFTHHLQQLPVLQDKLTAFARRMW